MKTKRIFYILAALSLTFTAGCASLETDQPYEDQSQQQQEQQPNQSDEADQESVDKESNKQEQQSTEQPEEKPEQDNAKQDSKEQTQPEKKPQQELDEQQEAVPTYVKSVNGKQVITNPTNLQVLVNKTNFLPSDYKPELVIPNVPFYFEEALPKKHMQKNAAKALETLFAGAKQQSLNLVAASGYRSYDRQNQIYQAQVNRVGKEKANEAVALPGQSEHQTGLAIDVTSPEMNYKLTQSFEETKEGTWLKNNAYKYGFIIRYPKGKEQITGYQYEPWHLRYVGVEAAKQIHSQNITLEQYVNAVPVQNKPKNEAQ
ncbi:M15 family metallopeptidase [Bacillus tianshenii]|nr:M15 family metallopeptidase [Bacillus tianshenii]